MYRIQTGTHPAGCDVPYERCDIDHIDPYHHGGATTQGNGRLRCATHNRLPDLRNTTPTEPETALDDDIGVETAGIDGNGSVRSARTI